MNAQPTSTTNRRKSFNDVLLPESSALSSNLQKSMSSVRLVPRRYSNQWEPPTPGRECSKENTCNDNPNKDDNSKMDEATKRVLNRDMTIFIFTMTVTMSLLVLSKMQQSPYHFASAAFRTLTQGTPITDDSFNKMTFAAKAMSSCRPITPQEQTQLQSKIASYEQSLKFQVQISEARGDIPLEAQHGGILTYLTNNVLRPQWSILELGCGAGTVLSEVQKYYEKTSVGPATNAEFDPLLQAQAFVGVELVDGFIKEMTDELKGRGIDLYQGKCILFHIFACSNTIIFRSLLSCCIVNILLSAHRPLLPSHACIYM